MLGFLAPHLRLDSVLQLDAGLLHALGLQGLLLDVDGTLKDYRESDFAPAVLAWAAGLRRGGVRLCLLSNGKPGRIGRLADTLGVPFVARAFKPLPLGCRAGLAKLGLPAARAALVGDQLFADVLAGRLAGLFTVLVPPTHGRAEPWFTRAKRPAERLCLRWMAAPGQPAADRARAA